MTNDPPRGEAGLPVPPNPTSLRNPSDHDLLVQIQAELRHLRKDVEYLQGEVKTLNVWFNRLKGAGYLLLMAGGVIGFFADKFWSIFHLGN